ncbi:MAG: hypothetical protein Q7S40_29635 [Opitutaceae bacterium]|nr:hypothetical protein [Opitutaceae bacterium]
MPPSRNPSVKTWSEKLHIYLGLYFLVFLWLFAASGLLLNHAWRFAEFWPQRQQSTREQRISIPDATTDSARAADLMRQLGLAGELEWTTVRQPPERFEFRVARPGRTIDVKADLSRATATVQEIRVNGWGVFRTLHTFTGVRINAPTSERDWILTKLWSFSMDAVAAGMVLLVITSLVLAYGRREKWISSAIALVSGILLCGFFVFGLRWL